MAQGLTFAPAMRPANGRWTACVSPRAVRAVTAVAATRRFELLRGVLRSCYGSWPKASRRERL